MNSSTLRRFRFSCPRRSSGTHLFANVYAATPRKPTSRCEAAGSTATTFDPGVLAFDQTYYWRVDSIAADGSVETGDLWHFTARVKTAYDPQPPDESAAVDLFPELTWQPGWGAVRHRVFFGESLDAAQIVGLVVALSGVVIVQVAPVFARTRSRRLWR